MTTANGLLVGRVALVTGGGQGVGRGIARALAAEGASVALLGRTADTLKTTAAELREIGAATLTVVCDVGQPALVPAAVRQVVETFGRLDVLVNNAWSGSLGPLLSMSDEDFTRGFATGPFATFALMRACHPHLAADGGGDVVNLVSSTMVRWDQSNFGSYAAAKAAISSLTRTAAVEWASDRIRVNAISPLAATESVQAWIESDPTAGASFIDSVPMHRLGDPQADIGAGVVALLGPGLQYLTGATIPLDGGQARYA